MEERTLLADIETEKQKQVEKKFNEYKQQRKEERKQSVKPVNIFSSSAFNTTNDDIFIKSKKNPEPVQEIEIEEPVASENSSVIEKPNYDFIESLTEEQRTKIFKIEKSSEIEAPKAKRSKFKMIILSVLFAFFGVWGIVNIAQIDSLGSKITEISTEYSMNLVKYLNNLHNLDATNSENMENLFQTIPEDDSGASNIIVKSNWFDRFCNFIAGLFGG